VLANAGVHDRLLSDLRTALTVTAWLSPETWLGTSKISPASAMLWLQLPPALGVAPMPQYTCGLAEGVTDRPLSPTV